MRIALVVVASCALSCGGSDAEVRTETVAWPTAGDAWSNGTPGTLTVGSRVDAIRTVSVPADEAEVRLRFAKPLDCVPNLSVTTQFGGIGVVATVWPELGAVEGRAKMKFPRGFTGTAKIELVWVNTECGPIEIAMDQSTITFAGAVAR